MTLDFGLFLCFIIGGGFGFLVARGIREVGFDNDEKKQSKERLKYYKVGIDVCLSILEISEEITEIKLAINRIKEIRKNPL